MYSKNRVIDIVTKIFTYYNGKINRNNPAILKIHEENSPDYDGEYGYFKVPNIIGVQIFNFEEYYNEMGNNCDAVYAKCIETIIHELFHAGQMMNNDMSDEVVESPVYYQTTIFLKNNTNTIAYVAGLSLHESVWLDRLIITRIDTYTYAEYNRANRDSHIANFISLFTTMEEVNKVIYNLLYNNKNTDTLMVFISPNGEKHFYHFKNNGDIIYNQYEFNIFANLKNYEYGWYLKYGEIRNDIDNGIYALVIYCKKMMVQKKIY